jgi:hypothetical protein
MSPRTPEERIRMARASGTFAAVAAALREFSKGDDRIAREARELEGRARAAADGLRNLVLLDETGGAGG